MSFLRLALDETRRLLKAPRAWPTIASYGVFAIALGTGLFSLTGRYGTMTDVLVLQPARDAAFLGVLAALILTLVEMQRAVTGRVESIVRAATDPLGHQVRQTLAIIVGSLLGLLAGLVLLLPYTWALMGSIFKPLPFVAAWLVLDFGAVLTTILMAAGLHLLTRRVDVSFVAVGTLAAVSWFTPFQWSYLVPWVQGKPLEFSDATRSLNPIGMILYVRLAWLLAAATLYVFGIAGLRRYEMGLFRSLAWSVRRVVLPVLTAVLATAAVTTFVRQPFIDNGPVLTMKRSVDPATGVVLYRTDERSFELDTSHNVAVSISDGQVSVRVDPRKGIESGEATYSIRNRTGSMQDLPIGVTPGIDLLSFDLDGKPLHAKRNARDNFMTAVYHLPVPGDVAGTLRISFRGYPRGDRNGQTRFWGITDEFVLIPSAYPVPIGSQPRLACSVALPGDLTLLVDGVLPVAGAVGPDGNRTWIYTVYGWQWIIAGRYNVRGLSAAGNTIEFVTLRGREKAMEASHAADTIADAVRFFTDKLGPVEFQGLPFIIAELDASFVTGGWGLQNMAVYGESMFVGTQYRGAQGSPGSEGGAGLDVAVHEIAHQWWGWNRRSPWVSDDPTSAWSAEGLTVYCTYLYLKHRFGEEYARREVSSAWTKDARRMQGSFYLTHLQFASRFPAELAAGIYGPYDNVTRYELMPALLLKAERLVGGEDAFVSRLREIRARHAGGELTYGAFLASLGLSRQDMTLE